MARINRFLHVLNWVGGPCSIWPHALSFSWHGGPTLDVPRHSMEARSSVAALSSRRVKPDHGRLPDGNTLEERSMCAHTLKPGQDVAIIVTVSNFCSRALNLQDAGRYHRAQQPAVQQGDHACEGSDPGMLGKRLASRSWSPPHHLREHIPFAEASKGLALATITPPPLYEQGSAARG